MEKMTLMFALVQPATAPPAIQYPLLLTPTFSHHPVPSPTAGVQCRAAGPGNHTITPVLPSPLNQDVGALLLINKFCFDQHI